MSIETGWRENLNKKINSRPSVEDVILRNLYEPKTLNEIRNLLKQNFTSGSKTFQDIRRLETRLDSMENITGFRTLHKKVYQEEGGFNGTFSEVTMYGFSDKIEADLKNGPDNLNYINRTSYFHLKKNM
jgi:hypothetical protein